MDGGRSENLGAGGKENNMMPLPPFVEIRLTALSGGGGHAPSCPIPLPSVPLSLSYDDAQLHEIGTRAAVLLTWFIGCRKSGHKLREITLFYLLLKSE